MQLWHVWFTVVFPSLVVAHMAMQEPPGIRYKTNPYTTQVDYDYVSPLSPSGSNFPCKGYHKDLGTPSGQSVRTYNAGRTYELILAGSATHAGGSCQLSLSYDGGTTWEVFKSFIGNCVKPDPQGDQTFHFTIPSSAPSGEALFAWSWFNNLGNREMYMNCAVVTITGGSGGGGGIDGGDEVGPVIDGNEGIGKRDAASEDRSGSIQKRSFGVGLFIANIGNGCTVPAGKNVMFPNPGPDVEYAGNEGSRAAPEGNCGEGNYYGGWGGAAARLGVSRAMGYSWAAGAMVIVWYWAFGAGLRI
ncbi:hypothetical protein BDZ91DRAFT_719802 [Kalaharituber pfeilii]|nr:hypothetical protein BDZ91DRAFT_719802 [Kalaharituber pfeilii]